MPVRTPPVGEGDYSAWSLSPPPLPFWCINLSVTQPCWRAGTPPCTSTSGRPTRNNDAGNAGASHMFPHPLSLLGVADPVTAVAPSPSWNGKGNDGSQRGEDRDTHHQSSHAAEGTTSTPRIARAPCGWCLLRLHRHHHHIPVSLLCALCLHKKYVQIRPIRSWARPRGQTVCGWLKKTVACKQAANWVAQPTSWCSKSHPKSREREKQAEELHPCLFHAAWCGAERSQHLRIFPVAQNQGIFFSLQENLCFFWMPLPINWYAYVWFALTAHRFENLIISTSVTWLSVGAPKCNLLLSEKLL